MTDVMQKHVMNVIFDYTDENRNTKPRQKHLTSIRDIFK